jgi:hypothetical protein
MKKSHTLSTALEPNFRPATTQQALAVELATTLGDTRNFACYLSLTKRFQEAYLRQALGLVMQVPKERIRKSRGALFVYLVSHSNRL